MNKSSFTSWSLAGALLAATMVLLPTYSYAEVGYRSDAVVKAGYRDHRDRRDYDRRHWGSHYRHSHRHPRHRHYVQRYYPAPHHYRPYDGPRYYDYGRGSWHIDLHYRFSGR